MVKLNDLVENYLELRKMRGEPDLLIGRYKDNKYKWIKICDNWNRLKKTFKLRYEAFDDRIQWFFEKERLGKISTAFNEWYSTKLYRKLFFKNLWYRVRYRKEHREMWLEYFKANIYEDSRE